MIFLTPLIATSKFVRELATVESSVFINGSFLWSLITLTALSELFFSNQPNVPFLIACSASSKAVLALLIVVSSVLMSVPVCASLTFCSSSAILASCAVISFFLSAALCFAVVNALSALFFRDSLAACSAFKELYFSSAVFFAESNSFFFAVSSASFLSDCFAVVSFTVTSFESVCFCASVAEIFCLISVNLSCNFVFASDCSIAFFSSVAVFNSCFLSFCAFSAFSFASFRDTSFFCASFKRFVFSSKTVFVSVSFFFVLLKVCSACAVFCSAAFFASSSILRAFVAFVCSTVASSTAFCAFIGS